MAWGENDPVVGKPQRGGQAATWGTSDPVVSEGTRDKPFDMSGGQSRSSIPRGAYYKDPRGNLRRNDNGDRGNPIVQARASVGGDVARSTVSGVAQSTDPITGAWGGLGNALRGVDGLGIVKGWQGALDSVQAPARRTATALRDSQLPGFSQIGGAALGAMDTVDAANPLYLGRGAPDAQQAATIRQNVMGADYQPQTKAGEYGRAAGRMAPNALMPGGAVARVASVVAPAVGGQAARDTAKAMGAGEGGQAWAELAGQVAGGFASGLRPSRSARAAPPQRRPEVDKFGKIAKLDPAQMRVQAEQYRAAGIDPTLVDVSGDAGRGVIRDVGSRMDGSRQAVTDFYDARATGLPGRIGAQAREVISSDARTPMQIQAELTAQRSAAGNQAFGAVRDERFTLNPDAVIALRSPDGRSAIEAATRMSLNSLDPAERAVGAELSRLGQAMLDDPSTPVTVGMAQQISKALLDSADTANRAGSNRAASLLGNLGRAIRDDARTKVPGYDTALRQWESDSRLLSAAETGGDFLKRNTDEFASAVSAMTPEEQALARATARRSLEARAGESIGSAPGLARTVALAPEQQARNAALLGPDDATRLQNNLYRESMAVRNAADVAPRIGPKTASMLMDAQATRGMQEGIGVGMDLATGNHLGHLRRAVNWFATRGINDAEASALANAAIDPAQLDGVISYLEQRYGPQAAQEFLTFRKQSLLAPGIAGTIAAGASSAAAASPQGQ